MRIELYLCDNCKKQLSKGGKGIQHLSMNFGQQSGWVDEKIQMAGNHWEHKIRCNGIKQFCNGKCLGDFFDKMITKTKVKTIVRRKRGRGPMPK